MPEGPEIRRAANQIGEVLNQQECVSVFFGLPELKPYQTQLLHKKIVSVKPRAKAMLITFCSGLTIYSHNQLYGKWVVLGPNQTFESKRQLRIALRTSQGEARLYSASDIQVMHKDVLHQHPFLAKLGPDLLDDDTTESTIFQRLCSPQFLRRRLGGIYLDQGFLAGTGNYLRSEILHAARLNPQVKLKELTQSQRKELAAQTLAITQRSYNTGGICLSNSQMLTLKKEKDDFEYFRFAVFGHEGRPCLVCKTPIKRETNAGRRVYFCPSCQL